MQALEVYTVKNKLLCNINVKPTSNICDIKKEIYKHLPKLHPSRQSIRTSSTGKDVKDSLSVASAGLKDGDRVYMKDLGPQISWKLVFLLEYAGPLFVYLLYAYRPWFIYGVTDRPFTMTAYVACVCWSTHYVKRILETLYIHRFSHGTMPFRNLFKNCGYYWGFAAYVAYYVNHPLFTPPPFLQTLIGVALFTVSELGNFSIHLLLRDLRPPGTTVRKIPMPNSNPLTSLYNFVSCPNYTYEFGAWVGFSLMTNCIPVMLFAAAGLYQMSVWAIGKHKAYKKEFNDYPKGRKAILPFVL